MKSFNIMNTKIKPMVVACALALVAGQVDAQDYYLAAKAFTKTLPDGSTVPMWGYVVDTGGACYNAATRATRLTCVNGLPAPTAPGPRLTVAPTDPNLRIYLSNGLPEPTSLVIPGQEIPFSANDNGPTWNDNTTGPRGADLTKRVRSYGREAILNGGRMAYIWNNFRATSFSRPGTFMYHSGTHPQKQVYMGLYGAVTKDAAVGEIYSGVPYDNDVVMFYSELDPTFNAAVAAGTLESAIDYHPRWFLVNGEPYQAGMAPISTGSSGSPLLTGENILVRFLSAASETHVPVLQNLYGTIHAEDGIQYTWQDGATVMAVTPRVQYSVDLPPLKTKDVVINPTTAGSYAVYDGNGYMTNPSDPEDITQADTVGGMLRFLSVAAP
jgi:FtsP/CotA-like multicopper oxidase with cupredoxin domain